jgi:osmotically-inducible protein OsmY
VVDPQIFDVTVSDGVVTLAGAPDTSEFGREIVRRVRHVPGVVAVRDRFRYPPAERHDPRFDILANFPAD